MNKISKGRSITLIQSLDGVEFALYERCWASLSVSYVIIVF